MKIAIPLDDKSMNSNVCVSFGRTPCFVIYDTEQKEAEFINNSSAQTVGGAGIGAAQLMIDRGVDALICVRLGKNAADGLTAANIKLYKSVFGSAQRNIDELLAGRLGVLTDIHQGFHGGGGR